MKQRCAVPYDECVNVHQISLKQSAAKRVPNIWIKCFNRLPELDCLRLLAVTLIQHRKSVPQSYRRLALKHKTHDQIRCCPVCWTPIQPFKMDWVYQKTHLHSFIHFHNNGNDKHGNGDNHSQPIINQTYRFIHIIYTFYHYSFTVHSFRCNNGCNLQAQYALGSIVLKRCSSNLIFFVKLFDLITIWSCHICRKNTKN